MDRFSAESLLRLPVRMNSIQLGHTVDVVLDRDVRRVVGLDVLCGDDEHRFVPLSAVRVDAEEVAVASALMLLDAEQLSFYRKRGSMLRALRGAPVSRDGRSLGQLQDVIASGEGAVLELVVGGRHVPSDERVRIGDSRRVDAA